MTHMRKRTAPQLSIAIAALATLAAWVLVAAPSGQRRADTGNARPQPPSPQVPKSALYNIVPPAAGGQPPQPAASNQPFIRENATVRVSDHVYVIPDFNVGLVPNVGIIVGSRATLVVDSGLGPRNGRTVVSEMNKVSKNADV